MKRVVIFVGAGFSAAFGLPLLKNFFEFANRCDRLSVDQKEFLRTIRQRSRDAYALIEGESDDFEHALSLAVMGDEITEETTSSSRSLTELRRILALTLAGYRNVQSTEDVGRSLQSFLGDRETLRDVQFTFITTNYDLSLEMALHWMGRPAFLPGEVALQTQRMNTGNSLYAVDERKTVLCKLHGSLNWGLSDDGFMTVSDELVVGYRMVEGPDEFPQRISASWPQVLRDHSTVPSHPLIVPPTLFKGAITRDVSAAWAAARNAISKADLLVILGYSFPDSDTYMKYFFAKALAQHIQLDRILLVDPLASSIKERLRHSTAKNLGRQFVQMLEPIESKWEVTNIQSLMR